MAGFSDFLLRCWVILSRVKAGPSAIWLFDFFDMHSLRCFRFRRGYSRRCFLQGEVAKDRVRFVHGHSAWAPGQLHGELERNQVGLVAA